MKTNDIILVAWIGAAVFLLLKHFLPQYNTLSGLNVVKGSAQDKMLADQWGG